MKKIIYLFLTLLSFTFLQNCEDTYVPNLDYATFQSASETVTVVLNGTASFDVKVYTTNIMNSERTFSILIDDASSADPQSYSLPSSVTVPANTNEGTISINFSDNNISNSGETLILTLSSSDNAFVGKGITINIVRDCPSDLAGTYSVISNGTSTDGAPVNNPLVDFAYEVEITKTDATTYTISDGVAGVYIDWYCDAYGYCFETEGNFTDTCGILSGTWVEGFDSTVVLTGEDNFDGTLTITWENGFGDTATAVYTKM